MTVPILQANRPSYNFADPGTADLKALFRDRGLVAALEQTRAFQRLKKVRFLGGIDYVLVRSPNGSKGNIRYTRYQHSLGVARLASYYCDLQALPLAERQLVCAAALLHDLGHAPFSHSLEPVFQEIYGLDHHMATVNLITGATEMGRHVFEVLSHFKVNVEELVATISGQNAIHHGFFSGPINFDTIEGILRTHTYISAKHSLLTPELVTKAATDRQSTEDERHVDEFWHHKNNVYRDVIYSRRGVLADYLCQQVMRDNIELIQMEDFQSTEPLLFRKLPSLRKILTSSQFLDLAEAFLQEPLKYTARRFWVDSSGDFRARNDRIRYRQEKAAAALFPLAKRRTDTVRHLKRDLFDDDSY